MPDVSMCANITCPLRETCYRFRAKPDAWQTFADFKPDENGNCDAYWDIGQRPEDTLTPVDVANKRVINWIKTKD